MSKLENNTHEELNSRGFFNKVEKFIEEQQPLDPEFSKILDEHFWELITTVPTKKRFKR